MTNAIITSERRITIMMIAAKKMKKIWRRKLDHNYYKGNDDNYDVEKIYYDDSSNVDDVDEDWGRDRSWLWYVRE
jgi:hypothetical protein